MEEPGWMAPGPAVVPSEGPGRLAFEKGARAAEGLAFTALVGVSAYPGVILLEAFSGRLENPAFKLLLVLGWECSSLWWVIRNLNFAANERHLTGFALGLLVPLFVSGLMANFPVELVLVEDLTLLLFFRRLFRLYPSGTAGAGTLSPSRAPLQLDAAEQLDGAMDRCLSTASPFLEPQHL